MRLTFAPAIGAILLCACGCESDNSPHDVTTKQFDTVTPNQFVRTTQTTDHSLLGGTTEDKRTWQRQPDGTWKPAK